MFISKLTFRFCSVNFIQKLSSLSSNISQEVIKKYGRDVPIKVPKLNDAIQFPMPSLHFDYENVWRKATAWACDFLERQEDLQLLKNWDVAYKVGWLLAHCSADIYLSTVKAAMAGAYMDWLYDNRWSSKQKFRFGQEFMYFVQNKKLPRESEFKTIVEMCVETYFEHRKRLTKKQDKTIWLTIGKFLTDELLSPDRKDQQLSVEKYIEYRDNTYMAQLFLLFCEFASGFEIPDELAKQADMIRLHSIFRCLMWMPNDLMSFGQEQQRNDHWNNFVTVYARENNVCLQDGVDNLVKIIDDLVVQLQTLMHKIVNSELTQKHPELKDYLEIHLVNMAYGNLQMYVTSGKYNPATVYLNENAKRNDRIDLEKLYSRIEV